MPTVQALWRHPIKGHSRERLDQVTLTEGQTIPWDRRWAVAHELSDADGSEWAPCQNFTRGSRVAAVMGLNSDTDEATGQITLTHPDLPKFTFDPDREQYAFLEWIRPIMPQRQPQSTRIVRVDGRGMTDTDYASVSLINLASHKAVAERLDPDLSALRWRCNIHVDGWAPWQEFDMIDQHIRLGTAELRVTEPIERCKATTANPKSGVQDADTLGTLMREWGHIDFGVYCVVTKSGVVSIGDDVEAL